ncbi:MAG: hypothetical protein H5U23_10030, partial [Phenylobacterium sp.]|nr:hypothetical protein [Phenylobacterium sp.]
MDLADASHLAAAGDGEAFLTFDRRFGCAASEGSGPPVRILSRDEKGAGRWRRP